MPLSDLSERARPEGCEVVFMEANTDRKHRLAEHYRESMKSCECEPCPCRNRFNLVVREAERHAA